MTKSQLIEFGLKNKIKLNISMKKEEMIEKVREASLPFLME